MSPSVSTVLQHQQGCEALQVVGDLSRLSLIYLETGDETLLLTTPLSLAPGEVQLTGSLVQSEVAAELNTGPRTGPPQPLQSQTRTDCNLENSDEIYIKLN